MNNRLNGFRTSTDVNPNTTPKNVGVEITIDDRFRRLRYACEEAECEAECFLSRIDELRRNVEKKKELAAKLGAAAEQLNVTVVGGRVKVNQWQIGLYLHLVRRIEKLNDWVLEVEDALNQAESAD